MQKKNNIATDSFILIVVQVITMSVGIVNAMILSRTLTKYDYGTYSQGLIIISLIMPFVALGLNQGINYFFNRNDDEEQRRKYIDTIFTLTLISGVSVGIIICFFATQIASYFNNMALVVFMGYIAFRPLISNLIALYQPLYISNGMAKAIAIRNLLISITQVCIVSGVSLLTQDIGLIFLLLLIMDLIQLIILGLFIKKCRIKINFFYISKSCIKPIFVYCIPMALATLMGTLALNMDKMLIAAMMSTEDLAIYSNASKELPLGFIVTSFTTVVMPFVIRLTNANDKEKLAKVWGDYIEIGCITTWIFGVAALISSKELFEFLYTSKYLEGLAVFNVYLLVSMIRFTHFGIILTSSGQTKWVLFYTGLALVLNLILNWLFYSWFGMIGPAISSFVSIGFVAILQLRHDAHIVKLKIVEVFRLKNTLCLFLELCLLGVGIQIFKVKILYSLGLNNILILSISFLLFVGISGVLQLKRLINLIHALNNLK